MRAVTRFSLVVVVKCLHVTCSPSHPLHCPHHSSLNRLCRPLPKPSTVSSALQPSQRLVVRRLVRSRLLSTINKPLTLGDMLDINFCFCLTGLFSCLLQVRPGAPKVSPSSLGQGSHSFTDKKIQDFPGPP